MNQSQQSSPFRDTDMPHLSLFHRIFKFIFFLTATPIAIWLCISFVVPIIFGLLKMPDGFVGYLHRVQDFEAAQSMFISPEITFRGTQLLEQGWPYKSASGLVKKIIPQDRQGFFISNLNDDMARLQKVQQGAGDDPPPPPPDGAESTRRMTTFLTSWLSDRFYPVNSAWWTVFLTRGWYALHILPLALGGAVAAYFIGEYNARKRSQDGQVPMGNRHVWWIQALKLAVASIPAYMALPVPLPTIPILALLTLLSLYAISSARTHYVEL